MKNFFRLALLLPVFIAHSQIGDKNLNEKNIKEFEVLAIDFLRKQIQENKIPGLVVSMVKDQNIVFNYGLGKANIEKGLSVDAESTLFRIGSITKLLTSMAVMKLVDEDKLDLNKPVNSYFKNPMFIDRFNKKVKVKDLLNHSGGFDQKGYNRKSNSPDKRPTLDRFLKDNLTIVREPGSVGVYDTYGITLAGKLIEEVSGLSYKDYMEHVFFPSVGMTNSYVESKNLVGSNLAVGYGYADNQLVPQPYEWYITLPASSIDATSRDMSNLLVALLNNGQNNHGRLFKESTGKQIKERQFDTLDDGVFAFSYGFFEGSAKGTRSLEHGGIVFGYQSKLFIIPELNLGFYIAYNRDPETGPPTNLTNSFTNFFIDYFIKNDDREEVTKPKILGNTEKYEGHYINNLGCFSCPAGSGWSIFSSQIKSNGKGLIDFSGGEFVTVSPNVFQSIKSKNRIQFIENENGEITSLVYRNNSYTKVNPKMLDTILGKGWEKVQRTQLQQLLEDNNLKIGSLKHTFSKEIKFTLVENTPLMEERSSTGGISWIDFDNDGDDDVFVTNGYDVSKSNSKPQTNWLYRNDKGNFIRLENRLSMDSGFSSGSAWADFDNDGAIDVFVPNQKNQNNFLYRNKGNGEFESFHNSAPAVDGGLSFTATWGDIDNDGYVDLFVSNGGLAGKGKNFLYKNENGKEFTRLNTIVTQDSLQSGGATFVDYDLDGDVDLYVPGGTVRMYLNDGNGNLKIDSTALFSNEPNTEGTCTTGGWADFDNDGDFDLLQVYTRGEKNRLYENKGNNIFKRVYLGDLTSDVSASFHVLWSDINNDGFQDVIVPNWGTKALVYVNEQGKSFRREEIEALANRTLRASMVASSDYDLDGDLDFAIGNWPNKPGNAEANLLFNNQSDVGNHIKLKLIGTKSNASAIGARIELFIGKGSNVEKITREIRSQDGFRSQSSLHQLIGIGKADLVDKVRIYWPSGKIQDVGSLKKGENRSITESL